MPIKILKKDLKIAIDGPVSAGKSTGAYLLAKKLNILYVYTGAMYRAVAWIGLRHQLDLTKEEPLFKLLKKTDIQLKKPTKKNRFCDVLVNNQEISDKLFSRRIHWGSSQVAVFPKIRKELVLRQQNMCRYLPAVMEGRDIGHIVLPNADLKVFMTASLSVRAKRRQKDLIKNGEVITLKQVKEDIKKRDYQDTHRKADSLIKAKDAWILNTSNLTLKQEVDLIINKLKKMDLVV